MKPYFPKSHGVPRVDDLRVISGIIDVLKIGLQWRDAPREYCPHKTLYNRFIRWSEMGVFNKIFKSLFEAESVPDKTLYNRFIRWSEMGVFNKIFKSLFEAESVPEQLQIDATHSKAHRTAHRTAAILLKKGMFPVLLDEQRED